jgi:hypothetical protein
MSVTCTCPVLTLCSSLTLFTVIGDDFQEFDFQKGGSYTALAIANMDNLAKIPRATLDLGTALSTQAHHHSDCNPYSPHDDYSPQVQLPLQFLDLG